MSTLQRIESEDGKQSIEILRSEDGTFVLRKHVKRYDREEELWYEVREKPDPHGRFADREMAIAEAKVILGLKSE